MTDAINELDYLVVWRRISDGAGGEEDIPEPRPGLDPNFDEANEVVEDFKEIIHNYIDKTKKDIREKV